jgi:tol-pal system protein YbgF
VQNEPVPTTEREAYAQAIRWMRAKRFEESTGAFEQLIVDYPNGQYTPNAFYWLGELHLAIGNAEPARQNFIQVIRLYPDHQKVPDALYKLGVLYFQLGDESESKRYLTQVQTEFPQSSAGALAKRYLAEME